MPLQRKNFCKEIDSVFLEEDLSRVINPDSVGKERTRLTREVVLALRELMKQTEPDEHSKDLTAFISVSLKSIFATVDQSVVAWEKRGYWVKADRFRMEWTWTDQYGDELRKALLEDDWATVAMMSAKVAQKFMDVQIPQRNRIGTPWVGAWTSLKNEKSD